MRTAADLIKIENADFALLREALARLGVSELHALECVTAAARDVGRFSQQHGQNSKRLAPLYANTPAAEESLGCAGSGNAWDACIQRVLAEQPAADTATANSGWSGTLNRLKAAGEI